MVKVAPGSGNIPTQSGMVSWTNIRVFVLFFCLFLIGGCTSYDNAARISYPIDEPVRIELQDNKYQLLITDDNNWRVGRSDLTGITFQGPTSVEFSDPLAHHKVYLFSNDSGEELYISNREVFIHGVRHARDLGGFVTQGGQQVKWGKVYRSDNLSNLSKKGYKDLLTLGITTVIDVRSKNEALENPDGLKNTSAVKAVSIPISTEKSIPLDNSADDPIKEYSDIFLQLATNTDAVKALLDQLILAGEQTILIHGNEGIFRTGFSAALFLMALGVPESTILSEFMASNYYNAGWIERQTSKGSNSDSKTISANQEVLLTSINFMKSEYGSIENYFLSGVGITPEDMGRLKELYLY